MAQSAGEAAQRRVLLFGLSANPPTAAHAGMVAELVTKSDFDAIWVLPVYVHMLDSKRNKLEKFEHRVAMCRMAFEHLGSASCPVGVKEIERIVVERRLKQRGGSGVARVGTADVLDHLSAAYPGTDFSFVMGADTYRDLRAGVWRRSDELLRRLNFVVFPRGDIEVHPRPQDTLLAAASGWGDVSSSKVAAGSDTSYLRAVLNPNVLEYMQEHELYTLGKIQRRRRRRRWASGIALAAIAIETVVRLRDGVGSFGGGGD